MAEKDKSIIVYSTPTWPFCKKVKEYLSENKIPFQEKNVAVDRDAAEEMIEKTKQLGVPVTIIDDKDIIIGFNQAKLDELLGLKSWRPLNTNSIILWDISQTGLLSFFKI